MKRKYEDERGGEDSPNILNLVHFINILLSSLLLSLHLLQSQTYHEGTMIPFHFLMCFATYIGPLQVNLISLFSFQ
jgi:hypothetical protein